MGAAMAPATYETIRAHLADTGRVPEQYDLIVTGDLGQLGAQLVRELFRRDGVELGENYNDCGVMLYDLEAAGCPLRRLRLRLFRGGAHRADSGRDGRRALESGALLRHRGAALSGGSGAGGIHPRHLPRSGHLQHKGVTNMALFGEVIRAFLCGGILCLIGQVLIDKTAPDPGQNTDQLCGGRSAAGGAGPLRAVLRWGGAGASVPLTGFGANLAKGVRRAVAEQGLMGAFTGGLTAAAGGGRRRLFRGPGRPVCQVQRPVPSRLFPGATSQAGRGAGLPPPLNRAAYPAPLHCPGRRQSCRARPLSPPPVWP